MNNSITFKSLNYAGKRTYGSPMSGVKIDNHFDNNSKFSKLSFKANQSYNGPVNNIVFFTDFRDKTSNTEAQLRFHDVLNFVSEKRSSKSELNGFDWQPWSHKNTQENNNSNTGLINKIKRVLGSIFKGITDNINSNGTLSINNYADIPHGNTDYSSFALLRFAARKNNDVFIHVVDPGVANGIDVFNKQFHDRTILLTKEHGTFIGPNNNSLGLLVKYLKQQGEEPQLIAIDLKKVEAFEKQRLNNPYYLLPETFHGRDVFAVIAAAVTGGVSPLSFQDETRTLEIKESNFAKNIISLNKVNKEEPTNIYAFQDQTFGNLKTNMVLTQEDANKLLSEDAMFKITSEEGAKWVIPFKKSFSDVKPQEGLLYLGSSYAPTDEPNDLNTKSPTRFVEIAINLGNASKKLNVDSILSKPLLIQRIK